MKRVWTAKLWIEGELLSVDLTDVPDLMRETIQAAVRASREWYSLGYEVFVNTYKTTKAHGDEAPERGYRVRTGRTHDRSGARPAARGLVLVAEPIGMAR